SEDILRAGRDLHVESVLSGEVFKQNETIFLRVRVLSTADGAVRLDDTFNVDPTNMLLLQDQITRRVGTGLGLWLVGSEKDLLTKRQTNNEEALRLYMHGRSLWIKRNKENVDQAISDFERALELDPAFAKAYTGLA